MNVVVLRGRLSRAPEKRMLPSGDHLVVYELSSRREGERAESVPVVWHDPPASALGVPAGEDVLVVGRVRRRYFRAGGATQSRTEVVADQVVPCRQAKRARAAVGRVAEALQAAGSSPEVQG